MHTKEVYVLVPVKMILTKESDNEDDGWEFADMTPPTRGDVWKADSFNKKWYDSTQEALEALQEIEDV